MFTVDRRTRVSVSNEEFKVTMNDGFYNARSFVT